MIRLSALAALFVLPAALAGCGGSEAAPTDPTKLPPLTEAQKAEMLQRDAEVAEDEQATLLLTPDDKNSKRPAKKATRVAPTAADGVSY